MSNEGPSEPGRRRGVAPNVPDRLPVYYSDAARTKAQRIAGYFDETGRPCVASAREVSPGEDNPLGTFQRLGERLAWRLISGDAVWPKNACNNVLSYYLIGRMKGQQAENLIVLVPWVLVAGIDILCTLGWVVTADPWVFVLSLMVQVFLFTLLAGLWSGASTLYHFQRIHGAVPFDEIALSLLEPSALVYGIVVRPFSLNHVACFFVHSLSLFLTVIGIFASAAIHGTRSFYDAELSAILFFVLLGGIVFRYWLWAVSLNTGMALAIRARLFIGPPWDSARHFLRDWVRLNAWLVGSFIALSIAGAVSFLPFFFFVAASCFICFGGMMGGFLVYLIAQSKNVPRCKTIIEMTVGNHRDWWMRTNEQQQTAVPEHLKDRWRLAG